jgi:hypothetical protein
MSNSAQNETSQELTPFQARMNVVLGFTVPVASARRVMILSKKQFVVWNFLSVSLGAAETLIDAGFPGPKACGFEYKLGTSDCKTWTDKAVLNAEIIGATPF